MERILIEENGMRVSFRIGDAGEVELVDFSASSAGSGDMDPLETSFSGFREVHSPVSVQITGESSGGMHAYKHNVGSVNARFRYVDHQLEKTEDGRELVLRMAAPCAAASSDEENADHGSRLDETERRAGVEEGSASSEKSAASESCGFPQGLLAEYHLRFYDGVKMARVWTVLTNTSEEAIGIEYVTSFFYDGISKNGAEKYFDKTQIYVPHNSWSNEAQWHDYDVARDLGLSRMPVAGYNAGGIGNNRFWYGNVGSWSTCEYLPVGLVQDRETGEISYFQIEHSGSWEIEYGSAPAQHLYLALLGPNDESLWWKNLQPGESFVTVPAAFGVTVGDINDAMAELTKYRRRIRRPNTDDEKCYVVFNDYMNCLEGDPTQEKEKQIIDIAAKLGCEYYCLDAGWYDKGPWWDRVGEWKESPERFPDGLRSVYDYARGRGMKMGMWLEIEVMGTECPLASQLPDDWFVCVHGKRRIDNKRYLLDFRNAEVRKYCSDVVDRLIRDYGCEYFKVDYNVTTGPGSDLYTDSQGEAMLEHYRALYDWYREIYRKYPDLVIENCGSGAQRMDYGMLALQSLQSTSDQTDYIDNSYIAANVASAVTPEQAGMWVYPYEEDIEHIRYNVVNGLLLRPYFSGLVWNLSEEGLTALKEGIDLYKKIRERIPSMVPFFPLGFSTVESAVLAYGLREDTSFLVNSNDKNDNGNTDNSVKDKSGGKEDLGSAAANTSVAYLSVFMPAADSAQVPLRYLEKDGGRIADVRVLYPSTGECKYTYDASKKVLEVQMPQQRCARLFGIEIRD